MAGYNIFNYNTESYNVTHLLKNLNDSVSLTDTLSKSILQLLSDSTSLADVRIDDVTKFLTEIINYTDVRSMTLLTTKAESINLIENSNISNNKALSESISIAETFVNAPLILMQDIVFLDENFTKQITSKGLFDSIRFNDWLSVKEQAANPWSD